MTVCVDTKTLASEATKLKAFYDAYEASDFYKSSDYKGPYAISINEADAKQSSVKGYQYVYGGVGDFYSGASAAFVREEGGEWVFFIGRQDITNCEQYDTELFKKALADETCQAEEGVQKTVREYYNL